MDNEELYKQLKRLEQENNSLQAQLNNITVQSNNVITALEQENKANLKQIELDVEHICRLNEQIEKLEQENKELKKQHYGALKMLKHEYNGRQRDNEQWFTRCTENHNEDSKIIEKYRSALEKIRNIINEACWDYTDITILPIKDNILDKIKEVLGDEKVFD